jgi:hypothetical protein
MLLLDDIVLSLEAQPLKVTRRQLVEGQGMGCAGDRRLGLGQGLSPIEGHAQAGI